MKIKKLGALLVSAALCAGMAAPAFAFEGEAAPVEQPVLPEVVEEDVVTVTDETSGALTPEGNLTLVDDYHTDYSDGSGQQFITLVSKSGATFYLVIDRNAKGQQTVHFMNLVDEADLLALMEEEDGDAYTAEKEAAAQAEQERKQAEEDAKKAAEEAAASGTEQTGGNKVTKYAATFLGVLALVGLAAGGGIYLRGRNGSQRVSAHGPRLFRHGGRAGRGPCACCHCGAGGAGHHGRAAARQKAVPVKKHRSAPDEFFVRRAFSCTECFSRVYFPVSVRILTKTEHCAYSGGRAFAGPRAQGREPLWKNSSNGAALSRPDAW